MNSAQRREWRRTVFGHEELTPAQRLVLLALESFADWPDGTNARPGVARLAGICGMEVCAVKRALKRGRELGLIQQTARANPRRGLAATHRLVSQTDSTCTAVHLEQDFKVARDEFLGSPNGVSRCTAVPPTYTDQSIGTEGPPRFCSQHPDGTEESCGPCGTARRNRKHWESEKADRDRQAREARKRAREDCRHCGGYLYLLGDDGTPVEPPVWCPICKPAQAVVG